MSQTKHSYRPELFTRKALTITVVVLVIFFGIYYRQRKPNSSSESPSKAEPDPGSGPRSGSDEPRSSSDKPRSSSGEPCSRSKLPSLAVSASNSEPGSSGDLTSSRKQLTWRVQNIPRSFTKVKLHKALEELTSNVAEAQASSSNILQLCLAPSSKGLSTATVTFRHSRQDLEHIELSGELHGLRFDTDFLDITPLYESDSSLEPVVDIVAVSGLAGHSLGSWKAPKGHEVWLRDFLPKDLPGGIRVLVFGYDTELLNSKNKSSITDFGSIFLDRLKTARDDVRTEHRPIIFLGHSLGGLVIKEALAAASECRESEEEYDVFKCAYALMMFGVPNLGLRHEALKDLVNSQQNEELINNLVVKKNSEPSDLLMQLNYRFHASFPEQYLEMISYYESLTSPTTEPATVGGLTRTGPLVLMVTKQSATYAGPRDRRCTMIPITANHRDMVKFIHQSDSNYLSVKAQIKKWTKKAHGVVEERFTPQGLTLDQKECRTDLNNPPYDSIRESKIDKLAGKTLQWLATEPRLTKWRDSDRPEALWITGSPGQGKSVLTKAVVGELEQSIKRPDVAIIYFFCYNQDSDFRTPSSVLRALIVQLLEVPEMFEHLPRTFQQRRSEFVSASFASLWNIFYNMVSDRYYRKVYCVLDALDECEDPDGEFCSRLARMSTQHERANAPTISTFKVFVSSRPAKRHIEKNFRRFSRWDLYAKKQDLDYYMHSKLVELSVGMSTEHMDHIAKRLVERIGRSFLWISVAIKELARIELPTIDKIDAVIDENPVELSHMYRRAIDQLKEKNDKDLLKMLLWVAYAKDTLRTSDLGVAISLDPRKNCKDLAQLKRYTSDLTHDLIREKAGTLIEVTEGKVHFIHQSVKDYIIEENVVQTLGILCGGLSPDLYLSRICMEYLNFEDWRDCRLESADLYRLRQQGLFVYAVSNWFRHIPWSHQLPDAILSNIDLLISPKLGKRPGWLQAYAWYYIDQMSSDCPLFMYTKCPHQGIYNSMLEKWKISPQYKRRSGLSLEYTGLEEEQKSLDCPVLWLIRCPQLFIAVEICSTGMLNHVLKSGRYTIDEPELRDALSYSAKKPKAIFETLLYAWEYRGIDNKPVSDKIMEEVALKGQPNNLEFLLERHETYPVKEKVLMAAIYNVLYAKEMIALLLRRNQGTIAEENIFAREDHNEDATPPPLDDMKRIYITERVLESAAVNGNEEMMTFLLERCEGITINEGILKAAVRNIHHQGAKLTQLLLNRSEQNPAITEHLMKAAVQNEGCGEMIVSVLLDRSEQAASNTEDLVQAALENPAKGIEIANLLLDRCKQTPRITAGIMKAAVECSIWKNEQIIERLLEIASKESCLKEDIVEVAVMSGDKITMELFHDQLDMDRYAPHWGRIARIALAVHQGDAPLTWQLLGEGIECNWADKHGRNLLWHATRSGHIWVMQVLLEMTDIDIESRNYKYETPLFIAVTSGFKTCAKYLLDKGANQDSPCKEMGSSRENARTIRELVFESHGKALKEWIGMEDGSDT